MDWCWPVTHRKLPCCGPGRRGTEFGQQPLEKASGWRPSGLCYLLDLVKQRDCSGSKGSGRLESLNECPALNSTQWMLI